MAPWPPARASLAPGRSARSAQSAKGRAKVPARAAARGPVAAAAAEEAETTKAGCDCGARREAREVQALSRAAQSAAGERAAPGAIQLFG